MKKSGKMLSIILAVIMVIGIVPIAASAENSAGSTETGKIQVYCVLGTGFPAENARIELKNAENGTKTYTADRKGFAEIPGTLSGTCTVSASAYGLVPGLEWKCAPESIWDISAAGNTVCLKLFPSLAIELDYSNHNAYMVGYSNGTFGPNNTITRAEVASLIYRLMTDEAREKYYSTESGFADVQRGMAHNDAIATLVNAGVIEGISGSTFGYKDTITRAQFAAMLGRLFGIPYAGKDVFKDTDGNFAEQYFNLLGKLGIMRGDGDGNVYPDSPLTRAQVCAMFNRLLGRTPCMQSTESLIDSSTMKTFSDVSSDMALYADILEATNGHSYEYDVNPKTGTVIERWTVLTPTISWISSEK